MTLGNALHDQVIEITTDYLGPAAPRFVNRQVESHLNKSPDKLTKRDLDQLISWLTVAMAFLTDNEALREEYAERLQKLKSVKS